MPKYRASMGAWPAPSSASARSPRDLLAHAARTGALRPGLILIGDKGFAGRDFENLATAGYGLHLVRPDRKDEAPRHGAIGWIRQWIESVNGTLKGTTHLVAMRGAGDGASYYRHREPVRCGERDVPASW